MVLSPPEDDRVCRDGKIDEKKYLKMRKKVYKLCRKYGMVGGVVVFHPYRYDEFDEAYNVEGEHWHICGLSNWITSGDVCWGETGWILKVIQPRVRKLYKVLYYMYEHALWLESRHTITWFGACAYNKGVKEIERKIRNYEPKHKCPMCGNEMVKAYEIDWTGGRCEIVKIRCNGIP
jgi:hypothetical protein